MGIMARRRQSDELKRKKAAMAAKNEAPKAIEVPKAEVKKPEIKKVKHGSF